jgi:hypothetical protein
VAAADAEKLTALKFSKGLACEAIVRHLEEREKGVLSDVEGPESERPGTFCQHATASFKLLEGRLE